MTGFVELCGAPGTGKSTLARALGGRTFVLEGRRRRLLSAGRAFVRVRSGLRPFARSLERPENAARLAVVPWLSDRILHVVETRTADPAEVQFASRLADLPGPGPDDVRSETAYRTAAMAWALETMRLTSIAGRLPSGVILVLDEGVVQRSVSLLGNMADDADRAALLDLFPTPLAVVHLVASPELLERRAATRREEGRAPRLHAMLEGADLGRSIAADVDAIERTLDIVGARGAPVLEHRVTEHDGSVRRLRDRVLRSLESLGSLGEREERQ
jgi:hypothetical protein